MKYLKIQNQGELDIRLVALMGGTTKANDQFKIGQFGTGLKYTLAYLFRNNLDFHIYVGDKKVDITTEKELIQEQEFEIICINGNRTSITTGMGKEWKTWMIVRELWANALDEGDAVKEVVEDIVGIESNTCFYIQITPDVQDVLNNWDKYFIPADMEPVFSNSSYTLYPGADHMCLYKNGILIYEDKNRKTVFRYDIRHAYINEMREYHSSPAADISSAIKQMNAETIEHFLSVVDESYYENNMDYNWYTEWGESWKSFMMSTRLITKNISRTFGSYGYDHDRHEYTTVPENIYKALVATGEINEDADIVERNHDFFEIESIDTKEKVELSIEKLIDLSYNFDLDIKIRYGFFENQNKMSSINERKKTLCINTNISKLTEIQLLKLLVERNEQINKKITSTEDTKEHFIDLYTRELLSKHTIEI